VEQLEPSVTTVGELLGEGSAVADGRGAGEVCAGLAAGVRDGAVLFGLREALREALREVLRDGAADVAAVAELGVSPAGEPLACAAATGVSATSLVAQVGSAGCSRSPATIIPVPASSRAARTDSATGRERWGAGRFDAVAGSSDEPPPLIIPTASPDKDDLGDRCSFRSVHRFVRCG
jgi:hypothetical protein